MEKIEREVKRLEKRQHVIDMVFGGLIVACVVCPLMMHLS